LKKKWLIISAVVLVVIALAVAVPVYIYMQNNYVAKVAGEKISKSEYLFYLNGSKYEMESIQGITDENSRIEFWNTTSDGETLKDTLKNNTLQRLKENKILLIKAKENGTKLSSDDKDYITQTIDYIVENNFGGKRIEADKALKEQYGITLSKYENILADSILIENFLYSELDRLTPSDEEVSKYFEENKADMDTVSVRHILFMTVDSTTGASLSENEIKAKEQKANEVKDRILAGEDMIALVNELSEDPGKTSNQGLYTFNKFDSYLEEEFKEWALSAKVGDVGVVLTDTGYHVMRLEAREPGTLEDTKDGITATLANEALEKEMKEWFSDEKYNVDINEKVFDSINVI